MYRSILILACLVCSGLIANGCQEIPDDPVSGVNGDLVAPPAGELSGLTYFNSEWGFLVRRPNGQWGLSAQTSPQRRLSNGLSYVEVRIRRNLSTAFRPVLFLQPYALAGAVALESFSELLELDLRNTFEGYSLTREKQIVNLPLGLVSIQWRFEIVRGRRSGFFPGDQFLAAVMLHGEDGYFMLGSGEDSDFPVADYSKIIQSLQFTR